MFRPAHLALAVSIAALLVACSSQAPTPMPAPTPAPPTPAPTTPASPSPSLAATPTPEPPASPEQPPGEFPATAIGLPVKTVAEMAALSTAGKLDGRFVAVGGYWAQTFAPCPFTPHLALLAGFCYFAGFADSPSGAESSSNQGNSFAPIAGPEVAHTDLLASVSATPVVLIVHGNDARAWQCSPDVLAQCHRRVVIDAVVWANGQATAPASDSEATFVAYEIGGAQLMDVDPRFAGLAEGPVRYTRTIDGVPDADGTAGGAASLVESLTGDGIGSMPMPLAADYSPGRLILDAVGSPPGGDVYPRFSVEQVGFAVATDALNNASSPLVLNPGGYQLRAYEADADNNAVGGPQCERSLSVGSGADLAYYAQFTKAGCEWREGTPVF